MQPPSHRGLVFAAAIALGVIVAACGDRSDDTTTAQSSGSTTARTADSGREIASTARPSGDAPRGRLADAGQAMADASTPSTGAMGAPGDKPIAPSSGEPKADDARLTSMVLAGMKADKELNALRIDVDTSDGVVTLSGSVPSAAAKAHASEVAEHVKNVRSVNNQLTLSAG